jgi:hypothetical protein
MPINYCDRNFSLLAESSIMRKKINKRMRKRPSIVEYYLFTNYSLIITINHIFKKKFFATLKAFKIDQSTFLIEKKTNKKVTKNIS